MEDREKDIQRLCISVLEMPTDFYDNPNGAYESNCPFCYETIYRGGEGQIQASMNEIDHKHDCAYLIAKDLNTGF